MSRLCVEASWDAVRDWLKNTPTDDMGLVEDLTHLVIMIGPFVERTDSTLMNIKFSVVYLIVFVKIPLL